MDLVRHVAANLKIEATKAEKGVGAILMALRMSVDPKTFAAVRDALPNSESLMGRALMSGGRTGEMPSLAGPSGLVAALLAAGYTKDDMPLLRPLVLQHLRPLIRPHQLEQFPQSAPVPLQAAGGSAPPRVPPALVATVVAAAPAGTLGRLPAATMARPSPTRSRAACGTCGPCPPGPPCPPFGSTPERGTTRPSALGASSAANVPGRPGGTPSAGARARPVPFRAAPITTGDAGPEAERRE